MRVTCENYTFEAYREKNFAASESFDTLKKIFFFSPQILSWDHTCLSKQDSGHKRPRVWLMLVTKQFQSQEYKLCLKFMSFIFFSA